MAIPLTAIALSNGGGLFMVGLIWAGIVAVNAIYAQARRGWPLRFALVAPASDSDNQPSSAGTSAIESTTCVASPAQ